MIPRNILYFLLLILTTSQSAWAEDFSFIECSGRSIKDQSDYFSESYKIQYQPLAIFSWNKDHARWIENCNSNDLTRNCAFNDGEFIFQISNDETYRKTTVTINRNTGNYNLLSKISHGPGKRRNLNYLGSCTAINNPELSSRPKF